MSGSGFVAVLVIDLHFPDAGSLKSKRKELSRSRPSSTAVSASPSPRPTIRTCGSARR